VARGLLRKTETRESLFDALHVARSSLFRSLTTLHPSMSIRAEKPKRSARPNREGMQGRPLVAELNTIPTLNFQPLKVKT
jgi:hypothetical protein